MDESAQEIFDGFVEAYVIGLKKFEQHVKEVVDEAVRISGDDNISASGMQMVLTIVAAELENRIRSAASDLPDFPV